MEQDHGQTLASTANAVSQRPFPVLLREHETTETGIPRRGLIVSASGLFEMASRLKAHLRDPSRTVDWG